MDSDNGDADLADDVTTRTSAATFLMIVLSLRVVAVLCVMTLARG